MYNIFRKHIFPNQNLICILVVTCVLDEVSNSTKSPDQATYDYLTNVTYTCNIGYELTSGDVTRTCQANGRWTGTVPICLSKKKIFFP